VKPSPGDAVAPYTLTLTLQRLVMEAGANRDFARIHHDLDVARASGAPGVYANTTFIETFLEAGIRSWAGPGPWLHALEFSMNDFSCVGDEITAAGTVREATADGRVELDVWVDSHRGRLVTGAATLSYRGRVS
jgi:hypothetical protein